MDFARKLFKNSLIAAFVLTVLAVVDAAASPHLACTSVFEQKTAPISSLFLNEKIDHQLIDSVIIETIEGQGNITSRYTVNQTEALAMGERWMGDGYKQIGKAGSGVFVSADGKRRFRIDNNSVLGNHAPGKPHVHLELVNPITQIVIANNHILLSVN
ncbi:hypothetical protein [Bdellovibrio sp. GT3]|uniref:hypothetical protein n=1 Tax=Bdellovibrio sp. GT3 TaxID=3136282 RepID=UPI0030EFCAF8